MYTKDQYINWCKSLSKSVIIVDLHFYEKHYDLADGEVLKNSNNPTISEDNYYDYGCLLEVFTKIVELDYVNETPRFYRRPIKEQYQLNSNKKYIAIHTSSKGQERNWDIDKWEKLINILINHGFNVVELGSEHLNLQETLGYINKTGLGIQDIADIIANSECFIGIDSALAHIANALNVKGVVLLGKYRKWDRYIPYSGNYQKGVNSKIVYAAIGQTAKEINVEIVYNAVRELLKV
ncbi:MAG: hypothetical protein LBF97_02665 [Elusimicrobiota bacterium]|jgi:ADP-heptose:LPS heptosyltransferase|nr:hypothetical protein [Elusimicrobiota bacterium]